MNLRLRPALLICVLIATAAFAFPQNQPSLPPEKAATVFGQSIRYFEAGQGPVVILLHGLGAVKEVWMPSFAALAPKYHVYAIDQIGFGHSDKPLLNYKVATFTDFLHEFMQTQNIGKATLVGNSLGGWIALDFASRHPDMVDKLVLVDAAGIPWPPQQVPRVDLNISSVAGARAVLESVFYNKKLVTDAFVLQVFTDHVRNNDGYTVERTIAGLSTPQFVDLASIHASTLAVWGRQDELIPLVTGEKMRDGIAGAKLVVLEQCGHVPEIEKPAEFNQALLEFLAK